MPCSPTQVGLTLLTVGIPTFFLTVWATPAEPDENLLANLGRFVIPAALVTAGVGAFIYTLMSLVGWFVLLSAAFRFRLLDRVLGTGRLPGARR